MIKTLATGIATLFLITTMDARSTVAQAQGAENCMPGGSIGSKARDRFGIARCPSNRPAKIVKKPKGCMPAGSMRQEDRVRLGVPRC